MSETNERLLEILDNSYLDGLLSQPMSTLRTMRDACDQIECDLSFHRRLLHGRVDILRDELRRRSEGSVSTPSELVSRLPRILSDPGPSNGARGNRLVRIMAPIRADQLERDVDALLGMPLGEVATASAADIEGSIQRIGESERVVSDTRRVLHERLDAIQGEMARRYRDGEADIDALLANE